MTNPRNLLANEPPLTVTQEEFELMLRKPRTYLSFVAKRDFEGARRQLEEDKWAHGWPVKKEDK